MAKLNITPGRLDLTVFRGASVPLTLTFNNLTNDGDVGSLIDLTPFQASLLLYTQIGSPFDALSSENGRLVMGGAAGTIGFELTPEQMAGYPPRASWALHLVDGQGVVSPMVGGQFLVLDEAPNS